MRELADASIDDFVICDFVAPLPEMRNIFKADYTIWLDTIDQSRYDDTNKMFVPPEVYDFRIPETNIFVDHRKGGPLQKHLLPFFTISLRCRTREFT